VKPIACDLTALAPAERRRHDALRHELKGLRREVRELEHGYAFAYPAERLLEVAEFVTLERRCCPFFDFTLEVSSETDTIVLQLTGAPGVKEFLASQR
jgi:hypothetical protein